jgi:cytochrome P450
VAPLIPKKAYYAAIKSMEDFIEPLIVRAVSLSASELDGLSKTDEDFSFLHSIARHTKDTRVIRDQIMSVLLAGRDTTAATLSWALYELCAYPTAWARMRREVLDVLGPSGMPTYETLKDLRCVRHVINETLRLHPAVPVNMRQALETTTIPGGKPGAPDVTMLKGDTVTILTLAMQQREDLYPPPSEHFAHPSKFSPERWERWTPTPWTYTPFHGGPRICPGQNFALTQMAFCRKSIHKHCKIR